jgi:hypothetical protein
MAGAENTNEDVHSPRTRGIIQHFERQVQMHTEALDEDVRVTSDRLGQLENVQIDTNTKISTLEISIRTMNTSIGAILQRLEERDRGRTAGGHVSNAPSIVRDNEDD